MRAETWHWLHRKKSVFPKELVIAKSWHDLLPFERYGCPKKFSQSSFHNFNAELSGIVLKNFWSDILSTYITFAPQNASVYQSIWVYLHLFTTCRCESDTLPKATILNVYNFTGFSVISRCIHCASYFLSIYLSNDFGAIYSEWKNDFGAIYTEWKNDFIYHYPSRKSQRK